MSDGTSWRDERREALAAQAAALERQRAAEIARARRLLTDFATAMTERGLAPHALRARSAGGATYRTGLIGWYIRRNHALAVGMDGEFYVLDVPARLGGRLRGVTVEPSDPPLQVGRGARDGESMPLDELLRQRLDAGSDFP
ncbi:hypothetical protein [Jiangella asiatica]|uniref:Uncharacterized protein n=1 Tax=Jiangella asiatica TaxID=2530372 RepID=A0A4R5CL86_9ACTN|nr:hypothetical protein [Jiangella asiatica]TDD98232.1 hypothetical protein E1269_29025 [Jiangella asiatica]